METWQGPPAAFAFTMPIEEMERLIRDAGCIPMRRTTQYRLLPLGVPDGSPLREHRAFREFNV